MLVGGELEDALVELEPGDLAVEEAVGGEPLDLVELAQIVQDDYGVQLKGDDVGKIKTVGDAIDLVVSRAG